jgi:hypothetical protein
MGVFSRSTSPYWWLWLETAPKGRQREKTRFKIGTTIAQRRDSRQLATDFYHQRSRSQSGVARKGEAHQGSGFEVRRWQSRPY